MTEELKIFNKPDGSLKSTIFLGRRIMQVDTELSRTATDVSLPVFNYPFILNTDEECMLLWAETNYDRGMWVNALNAIMQSTGQFCL